MSETLAAVLPTEIDAVLDVGTGTGHYAAAALDVRPGARALGLDVSVAACRRAARAHPRLAVVAADAWSGLPVVDAGVGVVLSVFSPRNPEEFARVLRPDGCVMTVTPGPDHLDELRSAFALLGVEDGKERRLTDAFGRVGLIAAEQRVVVRQEPWTLDDAVRSIMMGPNAFHARSVAVQAEAARLTWPPSRGPGRPGRLRPNSIGSGVEGVCISHDRPDRVVGGPRVPSVDRELFNGDQPGPPKRLGHRRSFPVFDTEEFERRPQLACSIRASR